MNTTRTRFPLVIFLTAATIGLVLLPFTPTVAAVPGATASEDEKAPANENPSSAESEGPAKTDDVAKGEGEETGEEAAKEDSEKSDAEKSEAVKLDGVFQAALSETIRIDLQEWSSLEVVEAVDHGVKVQAGELLIRLKTEKLQRAIEDLEQEIATDELGLVDAEVKLELARRSQDQALQAAAAADRMATEDLKDFLTVGRDLRLASLDRSVVSARNRLEYQAEELKQLEQMYAADDLTEETEEIILKRTRDAVESARHSLQLVLDAKRRGVDFDVPRNEEQLEQAVARAALALEEARRTAPQSLTRQELQFQKQRRDLEEKRERLGRLRDDAKQMEITAPRSGVVYYGTVRRGKWTDPSSLEVMLQPGGTPKARMDLMTVVQMRPLNVRVSVPEASLRHVTEGTEATVEPLAFPHMKLKGRVVGRSLIPIADGQFDAILELSESPAADVVPGMKAKVTVKPQTTAEAD